MRLFWIFLGCVFLCCCSSSQIVFSKEIIEKYNLTDEEVKSLQMYLSDDIYLEKAEDDASKIKDGKITPNAKTSLDKIIIPANAPGIILVMDEDILAVSFEKGSALIFSYDKDKYIIETKNNKVVYGGEEYILLEDSLNAHLLISEVLSEAFEETKNIPGIKLKD